MRGTSDEQALKRLGLAVFERRTERGLRQVDVAKLCGIDRAFISYIEHGRRNPSLTTLTRIAEVLGCRASDLLRDAGL